MPKRQLRNAINLPAPLREQVKRHWHAFVDAASEIGVAAPAHPDVLKVLYRVWACSEFVAQNCIRDPVLLTDLLHSGDLLIEYSPDAYRQQLQHALNGIADEQELGTILRKQRRREMVRIAWRDLAGWAKLDETLRDLSLFAEACVESALDALHAWQAAELGRPCSGSGEPQSLVVIGMGKLGGGELNFSSDIDLVFAYPEDGETRGRRHRISNEEYFVKLAQRLIAVLDTLTDEGRVFRVDSRLRPFGESGPLVLSFGAMEDYYQTHGREWERYAFIKARVVAGDRVAESRLMPMLKPFVYRRYLDFGAFEALRNMKVLIAQEIQRKGMENNIKLGWGGIREVEFIGQVFQLIRGGRDTKLQRTELLPVLDNLSVSGHLPDTVVRELTESYTFLRRVENHLQEAGDEQTHSLPTDENGRLRLAYSMGYDSREVFEQALDNHRRRVHSHFEQVFAAPQADQATDANQPDLTGLWLGSLEQGRSRELLASLGFANAEDALRWLTELRAGYSYRALSERGRARMDTLMPLLIASAGLGANPDVTLLRVVGLIEAIAQRSTYLSLLIENPLALSQLVKLCAASPWISALLTRHPVLLDELLDTRILHAVLDKAGMENELRRILGSIPEDDLEQQMEALRHFKQVQVLHIAAADIAGELPLMRVSDHLTWLAEAVLQEVLKLAWAHLVARHGTPRCSIKGKPHEAGFAVIGYGKLGGIELGYGSDLDLVFLHSSDGDRQHTTGTKSVENGVFFARLAQRVIHILNAATPGGVLYDVDVRLRPSGASGLLVSSLAAFADYQQGQAWTWEHQALVRARVVAEIGLDQGAISAQFNRLRAVILGRKREPEVLRTEVSDMRERMYAELGRPVEGQFDLKQGRGGIADIEFMVQYVVLLHAHDHPELLACTDNIRLLQGYAAAGLMSAPDVQILSEAYRAYRAVVHRCALQDEPARVPDTEFRDYRAAVARIWRELMKT
ncbi:MAG: bifunctional [glutamate--ammonia ligase]-adenylyl-L-tyrosine phosphorylase/[glutamate--ammonia-ligase] adenylyltransferase [Gammaproteobacteria bacterium]